MYRVVCLALVFLSGLTALVYQVTWQRYLAQYLGSHALAATLVLSIFFLFLSIGYFVIGRAAHRLLANKLLLYGLLEGLIGLWCFFSPEIFRGLWSVFLVPVSAPVAELALGVAFATLFLGLPTFLMGGTIPVLVDALSFEFEESHRVHALIYGINTAGAFAGTLLAGFVLIERFGLPGTVRATSILNFALFGATWILSRVSTRSERTLEPTAGEGGDAPPLRVRLALLAQAFLAGFYVFSLENMLIRMAGITLGSSNYTYSIIVASFILAIAAGSLLVGSFRRVTGFRFFFCVQSLLFLSAVLVYLSIPQWPALLLRTRALFHPTLANHGFYAAAVLLVFLVMLLVPVGLMGMNLPLLFNYLRNRSQYLSQVVGQIYAVNAVGSALGAVVGGYWLFFLLEGDQVFKVTLSLIGLSLPLLFGLYAAESRRVRAAAALPLLLALPAVWLLPPWAQTRFVPGLFMYPLPPSDQRDFVAWRTKLEDGVARSSQIRFTRYDPNTIVHVLDDPRGRGLYVNGKPDSHTVDDRVARTLTALVPLSLAPDPAEVFIVGLGGGLSTAIASRFEEVDRIVVAEISQGVIDALPLFAEANVGLAENRHKVEMIRGDAYRLLLCGRERYDLILSEPSNVWVSGTEKLFSEEFYREAIRRLEPGGIYAQWFSAVFVDPETFLTVLRTFRSVFPWATLWSSGRGAMVLLGSREPIEPDFERIEARFLAQRSAYESIGLADPLALLGLQALPPPTWDRLVADGEALQRLEHPILAYRAGRALFARVSTSLHALVAARRAEGLPLGAPEARFLLDDYPGRLSAGFFEALRGFEARYGLPRFLSRHIAQRADEESPEPVVPADAKRTRS